MADSSVTLSAIPKRSTAGKDNEQVHQQKNPESEKEKDQYLVGFDLDDPLDPKVSSAGSRNIFFSSLN